VLHGASESAARLKSATSLTLALPGMVAHSVTGLASASVHARACSRRADGRSRGERLAAGRDGRRDHDAVAPHPAQHAALDVGPFAPPGELELTRGAADLGHAGLKLALHHALRGTLTGGEPLRQRETAHARRADDGAQDNELKTVAATRGAR